MVEQRTENPCVPGSNPGGTTKNRMPSHSVFLFLRRMPANPTSLHSLEALNAFITERAYSRCIVLADSNTVEHCLHGLTLSCEALTEAEVIEVEPGEASKTLEVAAGIWQTLLEMGADRRTCLVCLGGGMVTDLGGFVASTFKRGIPYIYVPTTLLGMVDASIGGKTGINLDQAKNQIGCFSWPEAVYLSTSWLDTLPDREFWAGYAEMYKHALITDTGRIAALETASKGGRAALYPLIPASAEIKERIVERDPNEANERKILNFGHTAGHAFESLSFQGEHPLLHGEAVAAGICVALELSVKLLQFSRSTADACIAHLRSVFAVDPCFVMSSSEALWQLMLHDKKNTGGRLNYILLSDVGNARVDCPVSFDDFTHALQQLARP